MYHIIIHGFSKTTRGKTVKAIYKEYTLRKGIEYLEETVLPNKPYTIEVRENGEQIKYFENKKPDN